MGRAASLIGLGAVAVALAGACGRPAQIVIAVDTDLPLLAQVESEPNAFVPAATFDRVRIEMVFDGQLFTSTTLGFENSYVHEVNIRSDTPWPITFGIEEGATRTGRMLITAYRSENAVVSEDEAILEGPRRLGLERLVRYEIPFAGIETYRVVLHGSCLGRKADLGADTTCVADPAIMESSRIGLERGVAATVAGTASTGRASPCELAAPAADAICIKGGIFSRGDNGLDGVGALPDIIGSTPRHLASVHAFYMDRTEMTVGRARVLLTKLDKATPPRARSDDDPGCTWTAAPGDSEDRPLNCVVASTARAICKAAGGDLPSDAQWEMAARSRGARDVFVWGNRPPDCCAARIAERSGCVTGLVGPSKVGAFADGSKCDGRADVTLDGVVDLAGNVREIVRDAIAEYTDKECELPEEGIVDEPLCTSKSRGTDGNAARGGSFRSSFDGARTTVRSITSISDDVGFRCVYRGAAE